MCVPTVNGLPVVCNMSWKTTQNDKTREKKKKDFEKQKNNGKERKKGFSY